MYNDNLIYDVGAGIRIFYVEVAGYIYCDAHHGDVLWQVAIPIHHLVSTVVFLYVLWVY